MRLEHRALYCAHRKTIISIIIVTDSINNNDLWKFRQKQIPYPDFL